MNFVPEGSSVLQMMNNVINEEIFNFSVVFKKSSGIGWLGSPAGPRQRTNNLNITDVYYQWRPVLRSVSYTHLTQRVIYTPQRVNTAFSMHKKVSLSPHKSPGAISLCVLDEVED